MKDTIQKKALLPSQVLATDQISIDAIDKAVDTVAERLDWSQFDEACERFIKKILQKANDSGYPLDSLVIAEIDGKLEAIKSKKRYLTEIKPEERN
ncbi:MAG: hypothetical protein Kapaf2KO_23810 [Candidatus Kapaibacteriales bacterium]